MKDRELEKKIRSSVSPDKSKIWNKVQTEIFPENTSLRLATETGNGSIAVRNNKPLIYAICAFFLAVAVMLGVLLPVLLKNRGLDISGSFFFDVNPSVQVEVENGKVTNVVPLNDDAVVMLYDTDLQTLNGKTAEEVTDVIWQLAFETGYINADKGSNAKNAVLITGALNKESSNADFSEKMRKHLTQTIKQKGVYCAVLADEVDNTLKAEASKYGISVSKLQLIKKAIALGANIDESLYKTITVSQLNDHIVQQSKKIEKLGAGVHQILEDAEDFLDELEDILDDNIVIERLEDILDELEDYVEDGERLSAIALEMLSTALENVDEIVAILGDEIVAEWENIKTQLIGLNDSISSAKQDYYERYQNCLLHGNKNYQKPDGFDDDYEDWLEEFYENRRG